MVIFCYFVFQKLEVTSRLFSVRNGNKGTKQAVALGRGMFAGCRNGNRPLLSCINTTQLSELFSVHCKPKTETFVDLD